MWKYIVERGRPQMTIWRMRIAWWITKVANKHSQYVILIGFPMQKWLHEYASMLRYTYSALSLSERYLKLSFWLTQTYFVSVAKNKRMSEMIADILRITRDLNNRCTLSRQNAEFLNVNPLSTKLYLSHLKTQFVPRSKYSLLRL